MEPDQEQEAAFEVEDHQEPDKPRGLRDRFKAIMQGAADPQITATAPKTPRKKKEQIQQEFVDSLAPLLAMLIAGGMHGMLVNPWKPVAPSRDEADSMVRPLVRILSRRLAVGGKITPDTLDLLLALLNIAIYAQRAYSTYQAIYQEGVQNGSISPRQPRAHQAPAAGHHPADRGANARQGQPVDASDHRQNRGRGAQAGHGAVGSGGDIISDVLRADAAGRAARGLN